MIAEQLLSKEIPPLRTSDSGLKALGWMEEFRISHLPIVNHLDFLGVISEEDIYDLNAPEEPLGNHQLSLTRPYVRSHQHIYEVIKQVADLNLSIIPVLNAKDQFLGVITLPDLIKHMASLSSIKDAGGIIILELNERDYNLSQIAHIVESNDCKVLSVYASSVPDSTKLEVALKVNRTDLRAILATFHRFNYVVKASFQESEQDESLKQRFDMLMNYLNS
jgi:acetoin utilization protein AcuB